MHPTRNPPLGDPRRLSPANRKADRRAIESRFAGKAFAYLPYQFPSGRWGLCIMVANQTAPYPLQLTAAWSPDERDMREDAALLNRGLGRSESELSRILASTRPTGPSYFSGWAESDRALFRAG